MLIQLIFGVLFVGLYIWFLQRKNSNLQRRVSQLFSRSASNEPGLNAINKALQVVNEKSHGVSFTAEQCANILFRGHSVTFVYGSVGSIGPGKGGPCWRTEKSLFAIANSEQAEWMKNNPDIFQPAFVGLPFSVFFAKLSELSA